MRTIIEENDVAGIIDKAIEQYPRLEECYDGLKWRLSREPESGVKLGTNPERYLFKITPPIQLLPSITVLYELGNFVTIIGIKITPQKS